MAEDGQLVRFMFTGMYPHTTGITTGRRYGSGVVSHPSGAVRGERLQTVGVVSNAVVAAKFGWNRGFDDSGETSGGGDFPRTRSCPAPGERVQGERDGPSASPQARRGGAALAWIHYTDPRCLHAAGGHEESFVGDALFGRADGAPAGEKGESGVQAGREQDGNYYVAHYDANVLVVDDTSGSSWTIRSMGLLEKAYRRHRRSWREPGGANPWSEHEP